MSNISTQETARTLFLTADGIDFAYRLIGSPANSSSNSRPLLLLNHFRSTIDLWDPLLVDTLASTGRQVITYDYAGVGHSSGDVQLSIKGFTANLISFLLALLPMLHFGSVDILGFSMGGYVAQQLALDAPNLVNKLVLSSTGPSGSLGEGVRKPMAEVQSAIMSVNPNGPALVDAFFPSFIAKDEGNAWLNRSITARQAMAGKNGEPTFASFLTGPGLPRLIEAYLKWDADSTPYALLQTIQKDALVTTGQNDLIIPSENAYALSRQLPRANFVVYPSSGHGHIFQNAEFYSKQVKSFLEGKWPAPPTSAGALVDLA
ncbi:hypothetical protein V497_03333 [Pseudogymnoascus sp. VKM F-4516 (FW-969)]|nr:hypothetical protein V497_03333 [Pseudogymnoascus sp. VKM F-4516 (FW-969)]